MKYLRPVLFVLLLATLAAAVLAPDPAPEVVEVVSRAGELAVERSPADDERSPKVATRKALSAPLALFSSPPVIVPEVIPPPPPPPPQAPPLPFRVLGRYVDQKGTYVLLANDQRGIAVRAGDVIDGLYEIKAIEGASMTLLYLPLRQAQMLDIGMPLSLMN